MRLVEVTERYRAGDDEHGDYALATPSHIVIKNVRWTLSVLYGGFRILTLNLKRSMTLTDLVKSES